MSETLQILFSITQEQNEQIFKIMRQKAKDKRAAIAKKLKFELELMKKKSYSQIAASAITAIAAATVATQASKSVRKDKNNIVGEIRPKVTNISLFFAGFLQEKIVCVFQNKFKTIKLYYLRHI